jgi:hypothetical protein
VLINSVLSSLPMFMLSFFRITKGVLKGWTIIDLDFSGNVMSTRRSTGLPDGRFFTNL